MFEVGDVVKFSEIRGSSGFYPPEWVGTGENVEVFSVYGGYAGKVGTIERIYEKRDILRSTQFCDIRLLDGTVVMFTPPYHLELLENV